MQVTRIILRIDQPHARSDRAPGQHRRAEVNVACHQTPLPALAKHAFQENIMRTVRYDTFSGIDGLYVADMPIPETTPGHVLVRVLATCINPGALTALSGGFTPIRDLAGEVVAVGEQVSGFNSGDAVLGWAQDWSAHAQLVTVPATQLIPKPASLSWDVAGSLYVTPMAGLGGVIATRPSAEELVVVSGASGGVGFTAAQLAQRTGASVIGLASPANIGWLLEQGILAVAYGEGQEERVHSAAGDRPIAAFMDTAGNGSVDLALALGVPKERINTVVDFQAAKAHGVKTLGTREAGGLPALNELAELAATGGLEIPIAATYPLERVQDAYRQLSQRDLRGRIVLHPQE